MHHSNFILCVDVVEEDCELITEALHHMNPAIQIEFVSSGDKAVEFVKKQAPSPDMLIMAINLPGMDGKQTFLELKQVLKENIYPVMFLTTAPAPNDIAFAEEHGIDLWEKPSTLQGYQELADHVMVMLKKGGAA